MIVTIRGFQFWPVSGAYQLSHPFESKCRYRIISFLNISHISSTNGISFITLLTHLRKSIVIQ